MRNALLYIIAFTIAGCTTIENLEPNQTETFLKFYSETNEMNSKDLAVLDDGYLILSTYSETSTMLLKTDFKGNKIWAQSLDDFQGSALTVVNDGYIIIGDGINTQDTTYMELIKTDFDGNNSVSTELGNGFQHGSAVTLTSIGEIIALGYTSSSSTNSILVMGYTTGLADAWPSPRNYLASIASNSIYESDNGLLTWLSYTADQNVTKVSFTGVNRDNEGIVFNPTLFNTSIIANANGDFVKTPVGFTVVQTLIEGNERKIGITSSINGSVPDVEILNIAGNYTAGSIVNATNGLLIVGTVDNTDEGRTDQDLLLLEVNYDGTIKSEGINQTFGGVGNEIPVRIRRTQDGGFAVLGTLINSKGAQQTFLLKTNNKGELN